MTPFIRYVDETGWQFGFDQIEDPESLPFNFFYGSNVSLASQHLQRDQFDTSFPYPAWEDSELGYRLQSKGCRFVYDQSARVAHLHKTTIARFANRQFKAGYNGMVLGQRHPELGWLVWPVDEALESASGNVMLLLRKWYASFLEWFSADVPTLWGDVLRDHYVKGIKQYLSDNDIKYKNLHDLRLKSFFPKTYSMDSSLLHHNTGYLQQEGGSSRWLCQAGQDVAGHCIYGPYLYINEDNYLQLEIALQCDQPTANCEAFTIDIYDCANDTVLSEKQLSSDDFANKQSNQKKVTIPFQTQTEQRLEFRVYWHGHCDVAIDSIELSLKE